MGTKSSLSRYASHAIERSVESSLISGNVRIHDRRTSIRLEPEMWDALYEIADMENCTIHDLCTAVYDGKQERTSFTAALRVFLMVYYRSAAFMDSQVQNVRERLKGKAAS